MGTTTLSDYSSCIDSVFSRSSYSSNTTTTAPRKMNYQAVEARMNAIASANHIKADETKLNNKILLLEDLK